MEFNDACTPELIRGVADEGSMSEQYWTLLKAADRIAALESQLADASAEIARLRKALVWAARHGVFLNAEMSDVSPVLGYWPDARFGGEPELDLCPGTDASLIDVLCRLAEGE